MHKAISLRNQIADGYSIPVGSANIIFVTTTIGMIGCGAFDIRVLEHFGVPAAKMKAVIKQTIESIDEILEAEVTEVNGPAVLRGIRKGMSGREALELL